MKRAPDTRVRGRSRRTALATGTALATLAVLAGHSRSYADAPPSGLNVQRTWRVVGVAAATSVSPAPAASEVQRALEHAGRTLTRELGIEWRIAARIRHARYEDAPGGGRLELTDARFQALVEGLAGTDDALAGADAVFVFVSAPEQEYAGYSGLRARPRGKAPVWYAVVNVRQGPRAARAALERLELEGKPLGLSLDAAAHERSERALRLLASPLDRGPLQRLALWATAVHEFGHLLSPGTPDARAVVDEDAYRARMLENGPEDPTHHDKTCVMWTPDPASLLAKLGAFPEVVQFCNGCRRRLGLPPRADR